MRIIEAGNGLDQALDYVALIENGKLHGDTWPARDLWRRAGRVARVLVVVVDQPIAVQTVGSENKKHQEVGNHHRQVKCVDMVDALKSGVSEFLPILAEAGGVCGKQRRSEKEC